MKVTGRELEAAARETEKECNRERKLRVWLLAIKLLKLRVGFSA